jgi:hypothetical protein
LIKAKARIDHAKNAQLAYMIITRDLEDKSGMVNNSDYPTDYDPFGGP